MSQKIYTDLDIKGNTTIGSIANATTDTDKFLVSDNGLVKYRTGVEMLSDLGINAGAPASSIQHQVKAAVAINKGQAVYVSSANGTNMIVSLASNATEATSSKTMGLLADTVAINGFSNVVTEGLLAGLNTIGATAGDPVWLGTGGNLIYGLINKPYAPAHLVFIGIVTRVNASNGEIFVKVQNGFELKEIHDVDLITTTPVSGHILGFNGTLWVNKTIAGWLGYTPADSAHNHDDRYYTETESDSRFVNVTGDTMTGTLQINGSWATTILDGDNVVVRKPNYPSGGWARALLNFQEYTGTSLYQIGAYGSANTYTYGYLGTAYNDTIMRWYPNKEVIFDNVIKAPTFSDSNNTAYYLDPAAMSNIHNITANSFIKSGGTSAQILAADGSVITAGTNITISGGVISSTDTNTIYTHPAYTTRSIDTSGAQVIDVFTSDAIGSVTNITTRTMTLADIGAAAASHTHTFDSLTSKTGGTGTYQTSGDFRAPIFYDSNDTGYYINPNSTSNILDLSAITTSVRRYYQIADGVPTSNLGSPSVTEMALFDNQFNNKTAFLDPAYLKFYTSTDGVSWTEYTGFSDGTKRDFVGGDNGSGVIIPNLTPYFAIEVSAVSYVFLNALYMYWSSNSHSTTVKTQIRRVDNATWYNHTTSSTAVGAWPGHLYMPFPTVPFLPGPSTSTGHYDKIRFIFQPTWSGGAYASSPIYLTKFECWGGYPAGKRNIYATDSLQNVTFPASLRATNFTDSDNSAYYADPSSTSNLNGLTVAGTITGNISGNAGTATTLGTPRTINGTSFNGSSDIETSYWGATRTITIGNTGKTVNGSGNQSWTLAEIGAQPAGSYLTSETNTFLGDGGNADTHPGTDRIIFTGQLSTGAALLGMPATDNSNSILNINRHPGEYNSQLGFSSNGNIYYRSFSAAAINSTQAWRQVWDSGNDGSGSGLDADLLDGNHASAFALASHTHPYDNYQYWNLKTNGVQRTTITSNGSLDLVAGTNVSLSYGAGGVVTISSTDTNTVYTHPAYTTRSIDTSGAQVIDVFTSDAIGSVTNITTRTMTLADLGYTGATNANFYTLPTATSTVLGGVKLFSDTVQSTIANAVSATASRTYGVQVNAAGQMLVNVPWTDTVYTHPAYTARSIDTSGAQVIDVFTSDAIGSVTNITTRTMTLADIGAASSTHTHDLVRYSLAAPANIDSLTTANFRTTLFGSTTNGYQISTSRWNNVPAPLTGLNQYGTMFAWAGSDTQGFIAMDYSAAALIVGGGNADNINWSRRVLVEQSWTNSKYFDTGGEIYGTRFYDANNSAYYLDPADTTKSLNVAGKVTVNLGSSSGSPVIEATTTYGNMSINTYYGVFHTSGDFYIGLPASSGNNLYGNQARFGSFIDRNNSAYYLTPSSTSVLNRLSISFNDATYQSGIAVTNTNTGAQAIAGLSMTSGAYNGSINMFSSGFMDILNQNTTNGIIQFRPKATVSMYIDNVSSTSRVTIGGSNPASHPLRVTQQVSNVSIYADYDIVAYSDQSVKENIRPIENVLDRVNKSRGVVYDRIDSGEKNNIGFIAQELEVEFPELVVTNEDNTKAVKYQNAVAVLFEAVKEQQKQIEELKELVNKLITK